MKKLFNNIGIKVLIITIIMNTILFVFKLTAGILASSNAMVSDSVHSLSDVLTTIIVIIGLIISSKEADFRHQYGHERIESIFAIVLAFILFLTGLGIGYVGISAIFGSSNGLKTPGLLALIASIISILIKEIMFHYTMHYAKKLKSESMKADAWHHRSDALSSVGSLIGIAGARLGLPILDPICSLVICIIILKTSLEIFIEATKGLLDVSCEEELKLQIIDIIENYPEVIGLKDIKTRMFGNKIYIDADILLDKNQTLEDANNTAIKIHDNIEEKYEMVKHCNIHILPKES